MFDSSAFAGILICCRRCHGMVAVDGSIFETLLGYSTVQGTVPYMLTYVASYVQYGM
jgi:hypothetical protein